MIFLCALNVARAATLGALRGELLRHRNKLLHLAADLALGPGLTGEALIGFGLEDLEDAGFCGSGLRELLGAFDHGELAGAAAGVAAAAVIEARAAFVGGTQERGLLLHFNFSGGFSVKGDLEHDVPWMKAAALRFPKSIP